MEQHTRSGGYDWLDVWRRMYDAERAQGEAATAKGFESGADYWAGQADRFAQASRAPQPDGFMRFLLPRLRPGDHLLDIGAGAGRYEPTLERHVAQVLALEPSPAMRRHLESVCGPNTRIIAAGWPEADVPPCDIVIAAHVLYSVREIGPFLQRMHAVARRGCYLLLAYRHPASYASPFWELVHGEPRLPLPGALECLAALYQLGIRADLTRVPIERSVRFADPQAALADLRWRLRIPPDPARDERLLGAIQAEFDHAPDGSLAPRGLPDQAAVLWWERP